MAVKLWNAYSTNEPYIWVAMYDEDPESEVAFPAEWDVNYYARIRNEGFSHWDAIRLINVERVWAALNLEGVE